MLRFFALLLSFTGLAAMSVEEGQLMERQVAKVYENAREVSLDVLKRFPPEKYYYVGVGRSPTPVITVLKELSSENVTTLPISGLADYVFSGPSSKSDKALIKHFQRYLPSSKMLGARKVLLLDYTVSGHSFVKAMDVAEKALKVGQVEGYIVGYSRLKPDDFIRHTVHINPGKPNLDLTYDLAQQNFDRWAKYERFDAREFVNNPSLRPKVNPNHAAFKAAMVKRLSGDSHLFFFTRVDCAARFSLLH